MFLHGAGMVTAVGLTAPASCAAFRARVQAFREVPYTEPGMEPVIGAPVADVRSRRLGLERLLDLGAPALLECLTSADVANDQLILIVGTQEPARPGRFDPHSGDVLAALARRVGRRLSPESRIIARGGASATLGLLYARELMFARPDRCVIVGGVDSYLTAPTLRWLQNGKRLKAARNPDGMIPGEAAAFCAWRSGAPAGRASIQLAGCAAADEPAHVSSGEPNRGDGLTAAMRGALRQAQERPGAVGYELTDLTGERFGFLEKLIASTRVYTDYNPHMPQWHLSQLVGSVGAAAGACLIAWAAAAMDREYAPSTIAMAHTSSDDGARAVMLLRAQSSARS